VPKHAAALLVEGEEPVRPERSGRGRSGAYPACRCLLVDLSDDGRLHLVDPPLDMESLWLPGYGVGHCGLHIVVAVDRAAYHVSRSRLPHEGIVGALASLLALHLVGERGDREQELVGRVLQGALAILEVVEDAYARRDICFSA